MELWTKDEGTQDWRRAPDVLQGIAGLESRFSGDVLLVSPSPDQELARLLAAVELLRGIGVNGGLSVASRHPTAAWVEALREAGVPHVRLLEDPRGPTGSAETRSEGLVDVGDEVCPSLHLRSDDGLTASVCGKRADRLVLPARQLARYCVRAHTFCPLWREGQCEAA